jgi:hypothetical protein
METFKAMPLSIRLLRYKQIKREVDEFVEWEQCHHHKLMKSWCNYIHTIKDIGYREFCKRFFDGTLEQVTKDSYFKIFK